VETSAADGEKITEDILKRVGSKHAAYDFARLLLTKVAHQPFG
jgi:sister-chromatid-cohesion protein PDS5